MKRDVLFQSDVDMWVEFPKFSHILHYKSWTILARPSSIFTWVSNSSYNYLLNFRMRVDGFFLQIVLCVIFPQVYGHGRLIEPPSRASAWRYGFNTPHNYNDHELYCGGFTRQWVKNEGKCGICGDAWDMKWVNIINIKYKTYFITKLRTSQSGQDNANRAINLVIKLIKLLRNRTTFLLINHIQMIQGS